MNSTVSIHMRYNLHSKTIDALRGIAAVAVFFDHSDTSGLATNSWLSAHKGILGDFGVYVFFCLSGYLIWQSATRLTGETNGIKLYAVHRFTRLVPLYIVNLVFVTSVLGYIGSRWQPDFDFGIVLRHIFFTQDLYPSVSRAINPVLWTLTHEAMFYILAPAMLLAGIRNRYAILGLSALIFILFQLSGLTIYFKFSNIFYAFALGIFMYEATSKESFLLCILAIAAALYAVSNESLYPYCGRFIAIALALSCISLTKGRKCGVTASRILSPFVFLGLISYSLYIWHYQIIYIVEYYYPTFNRNIPGWSSYGLVSGIILCSICVIVSYISYTLIEKPSMGGLRKYFEKKFVATPLAV